MMTSSMNKVRQGIEVESKRDEVRGCFTWDGKRRPGKVVLSRDVMRGGSGLEEVLGAAPSTEELVKPPGRSTLACHLTGP